jgi:hypothetical protein
VASAEEDGRERIRQHEGERLSPCRVPHAHEWVVSTEMCQAHPPQSCLCAPHTRCQLQFTIHIYCILPVVPVCLTQGHGSTRPTTHPRSGDRAGGGRARTSMHANAHALTHTHARAHTNMYRHGTHRHGTSTQRVNTVYTHGVDAVKAFGEVAVACCIPLSHSCVCHDRLLLVGSTVERCTKCGGCGE